MLCPSCQHDNRPQAAFCEECGAPLTKACVVNNLDVNAQTLSLLGVALTVSTNTQYRGPNDEELMAGDFFGLLTDGQTIVEADWDQSLLSTGTPFPPVRQLEIED